MKRASFLFFVGVAAISGAGAGAGLHQLSVPDVGKAQNSVFDGLDRLARLDAYVIDDKGNKLGEIKKFGTDFTFKYQCTSSFNPAQIVVKDRDELYSVGYMTTAKSLFGKKGQVISPYLVKAWQESK